jgi:hypothetical protein
VGGGGVRLAAASWASWWAAAGPTTVGCCGASKLGRKLGGAPGDFRLQGRKQKMGQKGNG